VEIVGRKKSLPNWKEVNVDGLLRIFWKNLWKTESSDGSKKKKSIIT
jgi:hypothetical protein